MRKSVIVSILAIAIGSVVAVPGFAAKDKATKVKKADPMQMVYELYAFNGKGYGQLFVPQPERSFHLIAGVNNVVTPKVSDVAWSDESGEWMADWDNWEHPAKDIGAKLQVLKGNKVIETVAKQDIAMFYPDAYNNENSELLRGQKAIDEFKRFNQETDKYWEASSKYSEDQAKYDEQVAALKDKDPNAKLPAAPVKPEQPKYSVSQPVKAFVINLKPGQYTVRTLDDKGRIVAKSEKKLVTFEHRRTGIGYSIKPEPKWTYPEENNDRTNIIYYVGTSELFFNPMVEDEYNVWNYSKLARPSSPYTNNAPKDQWTWIHVKPKTDVSLKLYKNGKLVEDIPEKPWIVEQTPGSALGYNILEWQAGKFKETQPHFKAHKVVLKDKGVFGIELVDKAGKPVEGGYREARPIKEVNPSILFVISVIPFFFGLVVSIVRAMKTRSQFKNVGA